MPQAKRQRSRPRRQAQLAKQSPILDHPATERNARRAPYEQTIQRIFSQSINPWNCARPLPGDADGGADADAYEGEGGESSLVQGYPGLDVAFTAATAAIASVVCIAHATRQSHNTAATRA